jgi:ABC-type uncharacterized transport system permease subunit
MPATAWPYVLGAASTVPRPADAANAFAVQCIWVAVACLVGRVLMAAGRHKLVVQGG